MHYFLDPSATCSRSKYPHAKFRSRNRGEILVPDRFDVVIAGGGIAGSALGAVLAREGVAVAVLERDLVPIDRVRGEYMAPWGVIELRRLGLYDALVGAGGVFARFGVPYDENLPGEKAVPFTLKFTDLVPEVPGGLCMSHPAMCRALAEQAEAAGAVFLRGAEN